MIKFGAHAFVWNGEWTTALGNETIRNAAEVGFDLIEIPLLNPATFDAQSHKETLEAVGIQAVCSLALPKRAHMPEHPQEAEDFLVSALDQVAALGSTYLGGCTAYALGSLTGKPPTEQEYRTIVEGMRNVAKEAEARGITLALEACNRYETHLFNTLEDTRAKIVEVDAQNVKLHADTYHMNIEEEGFYDPLVRTADVLDYVHMSESHRGLVGTGTVNWEQVWQGLRDSNFSGSLVLESFAAINPDIAAATCLWRPTRHSADTLAREGLAFMKRGAEQYGLGGST